jgi:hypothetical protein
MAPGCAGVIGVVIAALLGLFVLIWLIKRMWANSPDLSQERSDEDGRAKRILSFRGD